MTRFTHGARDTSRHAPPALGRYFAVAEDMPPSGTPIAVLDYGMWQTKYGGNRDVLGSKLQIGPTLFTITGVAPRRFVEAVAGNSTCGLHPDDSTKAAGCSRPSVQSLASPTSTLKWGPSWPPLRPLVTAPCSIAC